MPRIESLKFFAIQEELETSYKLIRLGLGELQVTNNSFYFLSAQLLSQGLERFMKIYICLGHFHLNKKFPESNHLKELGHDLIKMRNEIAENYYFKFAKPQFELDSQFVQYNSKLEKLFKILSDFGTKSRYYNFDLIASAKTRSIDSRLSWERFKNGFLELADYEKLLDANLSCKVRQKVSSRIIILIEQFISAMSRQLIHNCLGQQAKALSVPTFFEFGMLYERDFGKQNYRTCGQ